MGKGIFRKYGKKRNVLAVVCLWRAFSREERDMPQTKMIKTWGYNNGDKNKKQIKPVQQYLPLFSIFIHSVLFLVCFSSATVIHRSKSFGSSATGSP